MATAASDQQKQTDATQDPAEEPTSQDIVADDEDLDSEDSLTFSNGVIEKIVAIAMRDVPGVVGMKGGWLNSVQEAFGQADPRKGVSVEVTPDSSVRVNISVLMEYGAYAPKVFEDVKKTVVKQVTGMTGLEIAGVNLRIEDVLTPEEYNSRKNEESHPAQGAQLPEGDSQAAQQPQAPAAAQSTSTQKEA
ncbi:MAG: Asp23/Gls24 family envelope stress response protein [Atopobiaceae bacterium]